MLFAALASGCTTEFIELYPGEDAALRATSRPLADGALEDDAGAIDLGFTDAALADLGFADAAASTCVCRFAACRSAADCERAVGRGRACSQGYCEGSVGTCSSDTDCLRNYVCTTSEQTREACP